MNKLVLIALCFITTPLMAQTAPHLPKSFTLQLSPEEFSEIGEGVKSLPYRDALPILESMQRQWKEQVDAVNKPTEAKPDAPK